MVHPVPMQVTERRVRVGDVELNVAEAGVGTPVVLLLHGFPDSWHLWRHQIPVLAAAGHRVVAPDLRGLGLSDRPTAVADYALPALLGDVVGLLEVLGIEKVAVVGHDWGAVLGWALATAEPGCVTRLAVLSVGHPAARAKAGLAQQVRGLYIPFFLVPGAAEAVLPRWDWAFLRRWAWRGVRPGENVDADRQVEDLSRPGALTAALSWYRANIVLRPGRSAVPRSGGRRVTCPVLGVWSTRDAALTERQMTASVEHVDGSWRYERIEGAGHWIPVEAPAVLNPLLVDFLTAEDPPAT